MSGLSPNSSMGSILQHQKFWADSGAPICGIPVREAFLQLSNEEQLYAHFVSRAAFHGTRIILQQTSKEAESIFDLIMELYRRSHGDWSQLASDAGVGENDMMQFLEYAAMFLSNVGNYRSNGDTKFIPRLDRSTFEKIASTSATTRTLFAVAVDGMYSIDPHRYGYSADKNCASGFYPENLPISREEVQAVQEFLEANDILPENTRLQKTRDPKSTDEVSYTLLIASVDRGWLPVLKSPARLRLPGNPTINIRTGDYSESLRKVTKELELAQLHVANEEQGLMIDALLACFRTGNHVAFKEAQTHWIKDISPAVELVLGFVETYQDPHGVRGAWEGIVAITNQEQSKHFKSLTERSLEFIAQLPWNGENVGLGASTLSEFESRRFIMPDFTSLDSMFP
ncbi:putative dipeptidyl peptidase [Chaetomium fimeti]|uniref:Dipeptidyl peptidase n=1 Tax=Chaetomium fimeti TaxID=1854472 RepID=A0AAE0HF12_9PEZI|nr:putative dipeptidyl peptidase [Chaetomium fimeti]